MDKGTAYLKLNNSLLWLEKYFPYIIIGGMAIALFFSIRSCNSNQDAANNAKAKQIWLEGKFDSLLNKKGVKVLQSDVAVTSDQGFINSEAKKNIDLQNKDEGKIKNTVATGEVKQKFHVKKFVPVDTIDTFIKVYIDTFRTGNVHVDSNIVCGNKDSLFALGEHFSYEDSTVSVFATLAIQEGMRGLQIDDLHASDSLYWRIATKKNGIFKSPSTIAQIRNVNPNFELTGTKTMVFKSSNKFWKWAIPVVGVAAGFYLGTHFHK